MTDAVAPLTRETWLAGQNEAFKAAVNGAPLERSLQILVDTARCLISGPSRCAFYIASGDGKTLNHVVGMPQSYAEKVEGIAIGAAALACALKEGASPPVLTHDVREEPRWREWLWLAEEYGYRGCWMFPVETAGARLVGSFAWYFPDPRSPAREELELARSLVATASIIIAQHQSHSKLRESEERLAAVFEGLPAGLSVVDPQGNLILSNPEMKRYLPTGVIPSRDPERVDRWEAWNADGSRVAPSDFPTSRAIRGERVVPGLEMRYRDDAENVVWTIVAAVPITDATGRISGAVSVVHDITEQKRAAAALEESELHATVLLTELQHRVRNTLGVVRSIARRTAENTETAENMLAHFQGRLDAFSRVQAAVTRHPDGMVDLKSLIEDELVAHATREGEQVRIDGADVRLQPKVAERISLALHELTTNAVKHGALISDRGRVDIDWHEEHADGENRLVLTWVESCVDLAGRKSSADGFGMELLRESLPYDLQAETKVDFGPHGLRFELRLPLPKSNQALGLLA